MMAAGGQAASGLDLSQHAADDGAQRFLHDLVVWDQAVRRGVVHGDLNCQQLNRRSSRKGPQRTTISTSREQLLPE